MTYAQYLKSMHWRKLRASVLKRDHYRCRACDTKDDLQAHHIFYRKRWKDSQPDDLVTLCGACHVREHPDVCPFHSLEELLAARAAQQASRRQYLLWRGLFLVNKLNCPF